VSAKTWRLPPRAGKRRTSNETLLQQSRLAHADVRPSEVRFWVRTQGLPIQWQGEALYVAVDSGPLLVGCIPTSLAMRSSADCNSEFDRSTP